MKKFSPSKKMFWKVMRLTFVQLILIGVSCTMAVAKPANGQDVLNKAVTFKVQSLPVKNILSEIEKQTHVKFVYSDTRIKIDKQVTLDAPNQKLALVLNNLFNLLSIHYQVSGNYIVLTKAKNNAPTENIVEKAAFVITGSVTDDKTGESIVGANVSLKGTSKGTLTDDKGAFTLAIGDEEKNGTLVISFVGYETQNVAINGQQVINIRLQSGKNLEEVVVTGVFDARTRLEASSAISILKTKDIERVAATSAGDYLKNIPGVFVNSGRGEIGNQIAIRGLTVFPNLHGYHYVSMQEDGLPITNINFGTDYYLRPDATTARIEAVRGGSASVTGANAPGGIFNYISKVGTENFAGEIRAKVGLEGDGKNPYYRTDFNVGGPLSADKTWKYNIGGFYRQADGARYSGYTFNNGGQLKLNISKDYGKGNLRLYAKFLDDHNGLTAFTPAENWTEQRIPTGFSYTDSYDMPSIQFQMPRNGRMVNFDSKNKYYSNEKNVGLSWTHDLGNGFTIKNNGKYTSKTFLQQGSQIVSPYIPTQNIFYILPGLAGKFGTYTFTDLATNQQLGTFLRMPNAAIVPGASNNFPGVNNQTLFMPAFMTERNAQEYMNQLSVSKQLDNHNFTFGMFVGRTQQTCDGVNTGSGPGAATIQDKPHMIGIKLDATDGKTYQVTSPQGFMKLDEGGQSTSYVDQQMMAFFFGHSAEISPKLNMDWGARYEIVDNQGWNAIGIPNNTPESPTFGGIDGNPLTLYDNYGGVAAPQINYRKVSQYISVSAGLNYKIDENQAMYLRLSQGGKSPDVNTLLILNSQFIVDNTASGDLVQKIQQFEMAYKFSNNNFKLFVTPFVSKLSNVALLAYFRNIDNSPYTPPIQFATYFTKGIEIEGDIALNKMFSVKFSALFQDSRAEKYTTWIANANGPADDVLLDFSGNKTGGVPPMMFNIAPSVNLGNFYGIVSYNYLSERPANTPNGWTMKGYNNVDISAGYSFGKRFGIQFNVTNALNQYGVMEWLASGGFPTNLNRDRITPTYVAANPNDSFSALRNMPRAYFMTATYKF